MTSPCTTCATLADCATCPAYDRFLATQDAPERACLRCVDTEWLLLSGESFEVTAARLGVLPASLERHLRRHGRTDLVPRITGGVYA
jgi:hypothetical protein